MFNKKIIGALLFIFTPLFSYGASAILSTGTVNDLTVTRIHYADGTIQVSSPPVSSPGGGSGGYALEPATAPAIGFIRGLYTSTIAITADSPGVAHVVGGSSQVITGLVSMSTETTGVFISSVNVSAALTVTANGANNTAITLGVNSSSVTTLGPNPPAASIAAGSLGPNVLASSIAAVVGAGSCTNCNATFNAQGQATTFTNGSAGSSASTLAVGTGTASNFTMNVTSPTNAISFLGSQFSSVAGGTTNFISLASSPTINGSLTVNGAGGITAPSATITSTINSQGLLIGTTLQAVRIQNPGTANDRIDLDGSVPASTIRITVSGRSNTDFESSTAFPTGADNVVYGRTSYTYAANALNAEELVDLNTTPVSNAIQTLYPYAAIGASVNTDGFGVNQVYFGNMSVPGRDTYFFVTGGTNTSCGASCAVNGPASTPTFVINGNIGSSNYGNVGINITTPTAKLHIVSTTTVPALSITGQFASLIATATFSSQISTINWNAGNNQYLTLTGTTTISFSNPLSAGRYLLLLKQDGTGGRTVTWPVNVLWSGGITPAVTATASKIDAFALIYDSIDDKYLGDTSLNH